jgi:metal-responsive CopG/Arc/MetJ family transcriptional regulator
MGHTIREIMEKGHRTRSEVVSIIRHYLYDDLSKSDIKEVCFSRFDITYEEFESCFSEAFTSL